VSVDIAIDGHGVAVVTINRPEKRNALDMEHYEGLSRAFERVRDDDSIRCAIVTGAGDKAFCAGADLGSWVGREAKLGELWHTQRTMLLNRGLEVWKPIIAAVNGHCVGGGVTLLLACDLRLAVPHVDFSLPEGRRGIVAANGGTQRLLRQLPHAVAMRMLLLGDPLDAEQARRWGLINEVVPADELMTTAHKWAERLAAHAPLAMQASKELALRSRDLDLGSGLRMEQLVNSLLSRSEDVTEGRAAFRDRREPVFRGM